MREIVLDTETTGLDPNDGHRVVEIGAVELVNHIPTGRAYQEYINPERDMPAEAEKVHGLSEAFLQEKPVFAAIAEGFLAFLETDGHGEPSPGTLVIHNASFDMKFLNSELTRLGHGAIGNDRVIDSLQLARQRFPGAPPISMRSAAASMSTPRRAPSMAPFWTPSFWRRSISG